MRIAAVSGRRLLGGGPVRCLPRRPAFRRRSGRAGFGVPEECRHAILRPRRVSSPDDSYLSASERRSPSCSRRGRLSVRSRAILGARPARSRGKCDATPPRVAAIWIIGPVPPSAMPSEPPAARGPASSPESALRKKLQMKKSKNVLVVLYSLRAEGTPKLTLSIIQSWRDYGVDATVLVLTRMQNELESEFIRNNISIEYADISISSRYLAIKIALKTMQSCLKNRSVAVVSMLFGWHLFINIGARLVGVRKCIAHVGNASEAKNINWKFKALVALARPVTTRLVCCTDYVRRSVLANFWLNESELITIPNGIDPKLFKSPGPALNRDLNVGMIGTLERHKDQATLIRSIVYLQDLGGESRRKPKLFLAGEGTQNLRLRSLVNELGLNEEVVFLGSVKDVPQFLCKLQVFAFSTTSEEGQGIALIEAMAARVPIVATDVGACREVLDGGRCGLMVHEQNPEALANAIWRMATDEDLASRIVDAALERVNSVYNIKNTAHDYLKQIMNA